MTEDDRDSSEKGISTFRSPNTELKKNQSEDSFCQVANQNNDKAKENISSIIGKHEIQISDGEEMDLHQHLRTCKKNPGHPEFIPIESFSLKHLPEGHQDIDLYEYIKATADLTVRIGVNMTSPRRPDYWSNTKIPYFLSELRGMTKNTNASGRVWHMDRYTYKDDKPDCLPCQCKECLSSKEQKKVWWKIGVSTAAHVVFDQTEAEHTSLRFFYDSDDSELVILKDRVCVENSNIEEDMCMLTCFTCDEKLGNKLEKMWIHFNDVRRKVSDRYNASRISDKLSFIVSHPHGCAKQVSVGQRKEKIATGWTKCTYKFTYTTCTCQGSSGAPVCCVGYNDGFGLSLNLVHSGGLKPGLNCSAFGTAM